MIMSGQVHITGDSGHLILGPRDTDYVSIVFQTEGVKFEVKPYMYHDTQNLVLFFKELAKQWKGWHGIKSWQSVEGDLKLDASHDNFGHVFLKIYLIKYQGEENESRLIGNLKVDAGSFDTLAVNVDRVLNSN
jgi:hypothetical protein